MSEKDNKRTRLLVHPTIKRYYQKVMCELYSYTHYSNVVFHFITTGKVHIDYTNYFYIDARGLKINSDMKKEFDNNVKLDMKRSWKLKITSIDGIEI